MLKFIIIISSIFLAALIYKFIVKDLLDSFEQVGKRCKSTIVVICIILSITTSVGIYYTATTCYEQSQIEYKFNDSQNTAALYDGPSKVSEFKNKLIIWTYSSCMLLGAAHFTNKSIKKKTQVI